MHNLCILFAYSMHNQDTKPKKLVFIRPSSIKKGGIKSELSVYDFCLIPYNISIWAKKKLLTRLEAFRATGWNRTNDIRIFRTKITTCENFSSRQLQLYYNTSYPNFQLFNFILYSVVLIFAQKLHNKCIIHAQ